MVFDSPTSPFTAKVLASILATLNKRRDLHGIMTTIEYYFFLYPAGGEINQLVLLC